MVRLSLEACVPDLQSPADIYVGDHRTILLAKKGTPINDKLREVLYQHHINYLDFPLPYETNNLPPYTFSEETEAALFRLVRSTFQSFKKNDVNNPQEIRRGAYEILEQAFKEFRQVTRMENPADSSLQKRTLQSILHLRTVGAIEDYLYEHAKNVSLLSLVMAFDYFRGNKQRLAEVHKVSIAGLFADIGMMKIPSRIVQKSEPLTEEERAAIQHHTEISAQFMTTLFHQKDFSAIKAVRGHHERCDGGGYPDGLRVKNLDPYTLILNVADSYSSMVSKRYFRRAMNPIDAVMELNNLAGKTYEEKSVKCLNFRIAPYPIGSVAHFAGERLVQITELDYIPLDFDFVQIIKKDSNKSPYNIPKTIRAFAPDRPLDKLKNVAIHGHLNKLGLPVDTYDLLVLYNYTKKKD